MTLMTTTITITTTIITMIMMMCVRAFVFLSIHLCVCVCLKVGGRLRSRIAEQLLNELEPDHHRIIVQLEQLQLEGRR